MAQKLKFYIYIRGRRKLDILELLLELVVKSFD
jgi:hypothetical protein